MFAQSRASTVTWDVLNQSAMISVGNLWARCLVLDTRTAQGDFNECSRFWQVISNERLKELKQSKSLEPMEVLIK